MNRYLLILLALFKGQLLLFPRLNTSLTRVYGSVQVRGPKRNIAYGRRAVFLGRTTLICDPAVSGTQIIIGDRTILEDNTYLNAHGGHIDIGKAVFLGVGAVIQGKGGVTLGDETLIGPYVQIYSSDHPTQPGKVSRRMMDEIAAPIQLGRNVWVGAGSIVLRGTQIAADSVVAAGSIVRAHNSEAALIANRTAVSRVIRYFE